MGLKIIGGIIVFGMGLLLHQASAETFRDQQLKYPRVKAAVEANEASIKKLFAQRKIPYPPAGLLMRVFKHEQILELWARPSGRETFERVKDYKVCYSSGKLGPKRQEGDKQVPEGFYHINVFNPNSNYHLSLGIDYPNASDKILGVKGKLGGSIFIHGNCVSIGCVAITDEWIKELYVIAMDAQSAGQLNIPVHIFPTRMNPEGMQRLKKEATRNERLWNFWLNLKEGFEFFEKHHRLPAVRVDQEGAYKLGAERP